MSCNSAEALFERFLDARIDRTSRAALLAHIGRCSGCRSVLEELRVVDALLLTPRHVELAANFTFATMAEARSLPAPVRSAPPLRAYLVSYVVAAWLIAGAAFFLAPQVTHAWARTTLDIARSIAAAIGGFGFVSVRLFGRDGGLLTTLLGALFTIDAVLIAGAGLALKYMRPQLAERLRS